MHTIPDPSPHSAMMKRMLNTADPTMVPMPTSDLARKTPVAKVSKIR